MWVSLGFGKAAIAIWIGMLTPQDFPFKYFPGVNMSKLLICELLLSLKKSGHTTVKEERLP